MRALLRITLGIAFAALAAFWYLTRPTDVPWELSSDFIPDAERGTLVFAAGGCVSCHSAPGAKPEDAPVLAGGQSIMTDFGTFYASNISSDPDHGIGAWSLDDFARAVRSGVSPQGTHYYPAFPYTAYRLMTDQDVADLFAFMQTLPANSRPSEVPQVAFPFSMRRGIGLWKKLYMPGGLTVAHDVDDTLARGAYLAEALGHCAECHTPRTAFGGLDRSQWMKGAPDPSGTGRIPGITSTQLGWSQADLVEYFTSGLTPDYDSAGGDMVSVIENLSRIPLTDRQALAAYVSALR